MKDSSGCPLVSEISVSSRELPTCEQTLGETVLALLRAGKRVSKYTICLEIVSRIDAADDPHMHAHLHQVLGLIFRSSAC